MDDSYKALSSAIVNQACKDYVEKECYRADVERFLKSEWCKDLTDIDGKKILSELKEKVKRKELEKKQRKFKGV